LAVAVEVEQQKADEVVYPQEESQFLRTWRRFRKHRLGMLGLGMVVLLTIGLIIIPLLSPFDYDDLNVFQIFAPAGTISVEAGLDAEAGHRYWLGTDELGRDVLTRLFVGGRITLSVAVLATLLVVLIGAVVGGIAGYFGGVVDSIFMRITDLMLAFPLLPTFLLLTNILPVGAEYSGWGGGFEDLYQTVEQAVRAAFGYALVFVIFGWMPISRQVRAALLHLRTLEFVEAARALGAGGWRITRKHLLPNAIAPILLAGVLTLGDFIIYESILSYLGMGVGTPVPSWGNMVRDAQSQVWFITNTINPTEDIRGFLLFMPGMLILITVVSINFIAEGLRDTLSPH
jgi:peptide/nickel transport system permease protein